MGRPVGAVLRIRPQVPIAVVIVVAGLLSLTLGAVAAADQAVAISDTGYTPVSLTIGQGDVVTWTNAGSKQHSVTADDGSFDSGPIDPGARFANLFDTAGTFGYHDSEDASIKGTVVVNAPAPTASGAGTPEPTPPAGTLPPDFRSPSIGPETSVAGPTVSPGPGSGSSGSSDSPSVFSTVLFVAVAAAAIVAVLILARRRRPPG
jgi:plastocyanin